MYGIFDELIVEASIGRVIIDDEEWPISFNTKIINNNKEKNYYKEGNFSILIIKNKTKFFELLEQYISLELQYNRNIPKFYRNKTKNKIKWLMAFLFVNATTEEFLNPETLLRRKIDFLQDTTLNYLQKGIEIEVGDVLKNSTLRIQKEQVSANMETPNKISLSLISKINGKKVTYNLPSIYYGISDGICYIYSILKPKNPKKTSIEEEKFNKQINRILYKLNSGIKEEEVPEYYDYLEGKISDYPEENITDVTHSFILSLNIFIRLLQNNNIKTIKAVPYLPVRYASREIIARRQQNQEEREKLQKRNNLIQTNLTNKFIRTFRRVAHHNKDLTIQSFPYEYDEFLTIELNDNSEEINNSILEDINNRIKK